MRILFAMLLACCLLACSPANDTEPAPSAPAMPVRIDIFEGEAYAGALTISYNGAHIDQARLLDADGEIALHAEPGVIGDTLFTCRWRGRGGAFGGEWRPTPQGSLYEFDAGAPIRRIVTEQDEQDRLVQVVYDLPGETLELAGFSHDERGEPLGCAGILEGEYIGRLEWRYDAQGKLYVLVWVATGSSRSWRAEMSYSSEGKPCREAWRELERSLWLPPPLLMERLGL